MKVQHKQKIKLLKSLACITITVCLFSFTGPAASQSEQPVSSKDIFSNSKQNPNADWLNKIIGSKIKVSFSKEIDITSIEKELKVVAEIPGIGYGKVSGRLNVDENGKTAEFIPHSNLIPWLNYKVTIADAKDTQGNPLEDDEWSAEKKPEKTFNNFDLNSDGFISPDEVDWQDKIAYFDKDGDNAVSHEEWEPAVAGISIVINEVLAKSAQSGSIHDFLNLSYESAQSAISCIPTQSVGTRSSRNHECSRPIS